MKRLIYIIMALSCAFTLHAQDKNLKFAYDVDFEMNFDNRELYRSAFSTSMTIFGARLTPAVGLEAVQKDGTSHRIMAGIDVMKDFGSATGNSKLLKEITLYYRVEKKFDKTRMSICAGIFPRRNMSGNYSEAFFSDSLKFYDNNLEGILLKFKRPDADFEVGCDWMGQYGENNRERFMIFTSGEGRIAPILSLGYSGYMYHFANSWQIKGLVDNILLNPYARFDFDHLTDFQRLSLTIGYLQAFQNNRKHVGHYIFPGGLHVDIEVRKWNIALKNMAYYGHDLMPYYNSHDEGGIKYGSNLYFGDPFFRVHDDHTTGPGLYDRFEVCYEPSIGKYLNIRVAALFHFHGFHYSGCQQIVGLKASF
jgi:hypothetical protein